MNTSGNVQTICGTVLLLSVVAAIVALALHGTITGAEAMAGIGTIITLGGGALAVHAGVSAGANARSVAAIEAARATPPTT